VAWRGGLGAFALSLARPGNDMFRFALDQLCLHDGFLWKEKGESPHDACASGLCEPADRLARP
jgi:hypothetical protein